VALVALNVNTGLVPPAICGAVISAARIVNGPAGNVIPDKPVTAATLAAPSPPTPAVLVLPKNLFAKGRPILFSP
jgi:hypothetical protein